MSEINTDDAREAALQLLRETFGEAADRLQILDSETIKIDIGWVFVYDSRAYLESRDESRRMAGNAPIIVTPAGTAVFTGTAHPLEHYLEEWREAAARPDRPVENA